MSAEQNKSIVRRYLEDVWGRGQFSALRQLVSEDVVDHDPMPGQPCGLEGQDWAAHGFLGGLSNVQTTVDYMVAEGDRVMDHWTFSATQTGEMFGMPATGKNFTISGSDEHRLAGSKIVEIWHREDTLSMMQQLGFAPAPALPPSFGHPSSGTRPPTSGPTLSESDTRARIHQAFQQMIDQGDLASAGSFLTPDFVGHYSAFPTVYGPDGFREFLSLYTTGLSERHTDIEDILVDGQWTAVRVTYHGKNAGPMFGMPPTGKTVAIKSLMIFRMAGDKAAEQWANNDDMGLMQQLGAIPETAGAQATPC